MAREFEGFVPTVRNQFFPLGKEAAFKTVEPLLLDDSLSLASTFLPVEASAETDNPYAVAYLRRMSVSYNDSDLAEGFRVGFGIMYKILKERAGGHLPTLSQDFIAKFYKRRTDHINQDYGPLTKVTADSREHVERLNLFHFLEKDMYKVLELSVFGEGGEAHFFDSTIHHGIVLTYFLFIEGLSDPANWEMGPQDFGNAPANHSKIH